jgi:hypothetical protein
MGRELRQVPADWKHPTDPATGEHVPLLYDFVADRRAWIDGFTLWYRDSEPKKFRLAGFDYWDMHGAPPVRDAYLPVWPIELRTHFQMYETESAGTPLTPVLPCIEGVARWCVEHRVFAFGAKATGYEQWLLMAKTSLSTAGVLDTEHAGSLSGHDPVRCEAEAP